MKKIAITGSNGTIGTVLRKGLNDFEIVELDLPESDVTDYNLLLKKLKGCDTVIHLAWDIKTDNFDTGKISTDNSIMFYNVYKACLELGIKRVIMASSVHADKFYEWKKKDLLTVEKDPVPDSPYGAHKVFMEALGKYYASEGLEVVCVRFGGVNPANSFDPKGYIYERGCWFDHEDCVELIRACLNSNKVPNKFIIVYGMSNNKALIHYLSNPFGWKPKNGR